MDEYSLTVSDIESRAREARALVKKKARTSSIAAALPIPFLDVGTDMKLMNEISGDIEEIFGISHKSVADSSDDIVTRSLVMGTSMGSEFVAKRLTPTLFRSVSRKNKFRRFGLVNIVGTGLGAVVSYFLMKKLGDDHVQRCVDYLNDSLVA